MGVSTYLSGLGLEDKWIFVICTWAAITLTSFVGSGLFFVVDKYNLLARWKIQKNKFPDDSLVRDAFKQMATDAVVSPITLYFSYVFYAEGRVRFGGEEMDTWDVFLVKLVLGMLFLDFCFYWEHRLFHTPWLYKNVHKVHHKFKQSVGVAFQFAHIVEGVFVNALPMVLLFGMLNWHISQLSLFLVIRITETIDAHCGYDLPFSVWRYLSGAVNHDLHHSANVGNFGMFHFWDWVMGTRTIDFQRKSHKSKAH